MVRDAASARPLAGAVVSFGAAPNQVSTRTDSDGRFRFGGVAAGDVRLTVRRLGYESAVRIVTVGAASDSLVIQLARIATLDTILVRATKQGVFGVVGRAYDFTPLPFATIRVVGVGATGSQADSNGQFFIALKSPGSYVVRASAPGHATLSLSTAVARNTGVELALMLDSATASQNALEAAYFDFERRVLRRRNSSAIISRSELRADARMLDAVRLSPSFGSKVLRFGATACVFVDGRPRPGVSLNAIDPRDVEAVEVYTATSEASGTLAREWPGNYPCGDTGRPRTAPGRDVVRWVVIWFRH